LAWGSWNIEKFAPENIGIAVEILSLDGTEPDIHLWGGVIYPILNFGVKEAPKKLAWDR